jgi:trans-AT polyketide synthase/acyltransferase/oxidoreductase domain-containing protein
VNASAPVNRRTNLAVATGERANAAFGQATWRGQLGDVERTPEKIGQILADIDQTAFFIDDAGSIVASTAGEARLTYFSELAADRSADEPNGEEPNGSATEVRPLLAIVPPLPINRLGDPAFLADHGVRAAYMAGSMANGIASCELVEALATDGFLASFGAAGLTVAEVSKAIDRLSTLEDHAYAFNLIHSPNEPAHEAAVVDLYLRRNIRLVEASAYLDLTLPVVRYRVTGIHADPSGRVVTPNRIIAKASRIEVATRWFSPPPEKMLAELVRSGDLTDEQAQLARRIPMAQDLTAEADSGGHTDNRPAITLLPTLLALRDRLQQEFAYDEPLRVGLGGGIAPPASAAAAFAMGAAYIVTGSVNQACVESGTCDLVRKMLAEAQQADVIMAPAADMFEMGVKLQVLRRGTMFAMRAAKLFELYRTHNSLEEIPAAERATLEKTIFRAPLEDIWRQTQMFFAQRDPAQVDRATADPKHRMALVFRWYLGLSSVWANRGDASRQVDYQVWCGPAMGALNEWTKDTPLALPENRKAAVLAWNLMYGAAVCTRIAAARNQGIALPTQPTQVRPRSMAELTEYLP